MTNLLDPICTINSVTSYPAPWELRGKGYILLYKFPKDFVMEAGLIPAFLRDSFTGDLGAVMVVDYSASNAGPYSELLFIPGKFRFGGKKLNCITKIYVSTWESVVNGWANWAIPKERADFRFTSRENERRETIIVLKNNEPVIDFSLKHSRFSFPIHTALIPFPLVQENDSRLYYTNFTGKGTAQLAQIEEVKVNSELFPDIHPYRPLMSMRIDHFEVTFSPARVTGFSNIPVPVMNELPVTSVLACN